MKKGKLNKNNMYNLYILLTYGKYCAILSTPRKGSDSINDGTMK